MRSASPRERKKAVPHPCPPRQIPKSRSANNRPRNALFIRSARKGFLTVDEEIPPAVGDWVGAYCATPADPLIPNLRVPGSAIFSTTKQNKTDREGKKNRHADSGPDASKLVLDSSGLLVDPQLLSR